nr:Sec-independent protein translocase subunit TatB [Campylobacter sp.]
MFGMSFAEIIIIGIVAVIFLGPDKLPDAIIKFAKYFKMLKQTVNSARSTFENEVKIAELKEDAKRFKDDLSKTGSNLRKKLTFEELDELKKTTQSALNSANESVDSIKKQVKSPLETLNNDDLIEPNDTNSQTNEPNLDQNKSENQLNLQENLQDLQDQSTTPNLTQNLSKGQSNV